MQSGTWKDLLSGVLGLIKLAATLEYHSMVQGHSMSITDTDVVGDIPLIKHSTEPTQHWV